MIDRGLIQICIKLFKEVFTTLNLVMKQDTVICFEGKFQRPNVNGYYIYLLLHFLHLDLSMI